MLKKQKREVNFADWHDLEISQEFNFADLYKNREIREILFFIRTK